MVFVPPFTVEKIKKLGRFVNTIAQFTNAKSIHSGFYKWKMMDDDQKKFILQWPLMPNVFIEHLSKKHPAYLFNEGLSNEPNFGQIHLARTYL